MLHRRHLKIGPSMYTTELAERVMGPAVWLQNQVSYTLLCTPTYCSSSLATRQLTLFVSYFLGN